MASVISTQLNDVVVANFTAAELNAGPTRSFLAVFLEADPARETAITGIDFGAQVQPVDEAVTEVLVQVVRNLTPDPGVDFGAQVNSGLAAMSASKLVRPYFRFVNGGAPYDRSDQRQAPIKLAAGVSHTIALHFGLSGALVNGISCYLLVSGYFGTPGQRGPKLKPY